MNRPKLNYRFHVADDPEKLTKELLLVCIEANRKKVENALKDEAVVTPEEEAQHEQYHERAMSEIYEAKLIGEGLADLGQGKTVDGSAVRKKLGGKYGF